MDKLFELMWTVGLSVGEKLPSLEGLNWVYREKSKKVNHKSENDKKITVSRGTNQK